MRIRFGELEASSSGMRETFALLERLAPTAVTLSLWGETGTGKGKLARAVHAVSPRRSGPFVALDCGAVGANSMETALFEAFEAAEGGTLFLEEVAAVPLPLQPRLLRALETHSIRSADDSAYRSIDVRVVTATTRDLRALVAERGFSEQLYFCLSAATVAVPPLRDRLEDLPLLVPELLQSLGHPDVTVAPDALETLRSRSWPGNLRQLKHALACSLSFVESGSLEKRHLKLSLAEADDSDLDRLPLGGRSLAEIERAAIVQTLKLTGGMKAQAARALGIAVSTLYDKLKKYGI